MTSQDYYDEIDAVLREYEQNKPWHTKDIFWACDRIDWAWKWKKIDEHQMENLSDRACKILKK